MAGYIALSSLAHARAAVQAAESAQAINSIVDRAKKKKTSHPAAVRAVSCGVAGATNVTFYRHLLPVSAFTFVTTFDTFFCEKMYFPSLFLAPLSFAAYSPNLFWSLSFPSQSLEKKNAARSSEGDVSPLRTLVWLIGPSVASTTRRTASTMDKTRSTSPCGKKRGRG